MKQKCAFNYYKLAIKNERIPTFSEVCKKVPENNKSSKQRKILTDMTRCQSLQSYASSMMSDRYEFSFLICDANHFYEEFDNIKLWNSLKLYKKSNYEIISF